MTKKRILVVDDEPQVTRWLKILLDREGTYEVREENDSRCALAVAREFQPDLVFSDIDMPHVDGGALAASLAKEFQKRVPIVFLSSLISRQEATSGGVRTVSGYPFLPKPSSKAEVLACLAQHFGNGDTSIVEVTQITGQPFVLNHVPDTGLVRIKPGK